MRDDEIDIYYVVNPEFLPSHKVYYCEECGTRLLNPSQIYEDEHHDFLCGSCLKILHSKNWW